MSILQQLLALGPKDLLSLGVLAAVVTMIGNLAATVLKELVLSRSLEKWKTRQSAHAVYRRLRDPLLLASIELLHRIREIVYQAPTDFLDATLLHERPTGPATNSAEDVYYRRYKLISTVYRLCAWLGWTELYRQSVTFLDSGSESANRRLERQVQKVRADLADGHLNDAADWAEWDDALILREEQRAIGETMLPKGVAGSDGILGYAAYCKAFDDTSATDGQHWLKTAAGFVLNLKVSKEKKDFRRVRCLRIICHLVDLVSDLDSSRVSQELKMLRQQAAKDLTAYAVAEPL